MERLNAFISTKALKRPQTRYLSRLRRVHPVTNRNYCVKIIKSDVPCYSPIFFVLRYREFLGSSILLQSGSKICFLNSSVYFRSLVFIPQNLPKNSSTPQKTAQSFRKLRYSFFFISFFQKITSTHECRANNPLLRPAFLHF